MLIRLNKSAKTVNVILKLFECKIHFKLAEFNSNKNKVVNFFWEYVHFGPFRGEGPGQIMIRTTKNQIFLNPPPIFI